MCRGTSQHDYIGFALRVDTPYIFAIIILLFAFVNVVIHASTLSLHLYIHALIQAQRIILPIHIAQPYRLRIYFKIYGSRSPVTETYQYLSTLQAGLTGLIIPSLERWPRRTVPSRRRLHTQIFIPHALQYQDYTCSTHVTWLPHVRHMALTQSLHAHLLALQVPRPITTPTWPPHGLSTWYTPIKLELRSSGIWLKARYLGTPIPRPIHYITWYWAQPQQLFLMRYNSAIFLLFYYFSSSTPRYSSY